MESAKDYGEDSYCVVDGSELSKAREVGEEDVVDEDSELSEAREVGKVDEDVKGDEKNKDPKSDEEKKDNDDELQYEDSELSSKLGRVIMHTAKATSIAGCLRHEMRGTKHESLFEKLLTVLLDAQVDATSLFVDELQHPHKLAKPVAPVPASMLPQLWLAPEKPERLRD